MISDGAGSAIITWNMIAGSPVTSWEVLAQKVDTSGTTLWGPGVSVGHKLTDELYPDIVSDGAGGAIITWFDRDDWNIYAQMLDASGAPLWGTYGVGVCTYSHDQTNPRITTDGAGGAIVAWEDRRDGWWGVYTQSVDLTGSLLWDPDGVAVCTVAGDQLEIQMVPDGGGGAVLTWEDYRSEQGIYAQRVDGGGAPLPPICAPP